jgi:hypothetical protein
VSGHALDGFAYPSDQWRNGRSIVLFASHHDLNPNGPFGARDFALKLIEASVHRTQTASKTQTISELTPADRLYLFCTCTVAFCRFLSIEPNEFTKSFEN